MSPVLIVAGLATERRLARLLAGAILVLGAATCVTPACAQGGPPVVTDDPGTPGDGHWEINLAAIYAKTHGRRELALPDADINYGLGEHIQLKIDIPWVFVDDSSVGGRKNGLGAGNFGVKWRFIDAEDGRFAMSTYPSYTRNIFRSSARRGLSDEHSSFYLPIQATKEIGGWGLDGEIGRNFVAHDPDEWAVGLVVGHACGEKVECLGEVRETIAPHVRQSLLNAGLRAHLTESVSFIGAVGRDFGGPSDQRRSVLVYAGLQLQL